MHCSLFPSMLPIALMAAVFSSMLEYKEWNYQSAVARRWIGCTGTEMAGGSQTCYFSVCSVSVFLIGIPIMYYTADLTTISDSVLEAATMDGAKTRHQVVSGDLSDVKKYT